MEIKLSKQLLIGGCQDGQWLEVPIDIPILRVTKPFEYLVRGESGTTISNVEYDSYKLSEFYTPTKTFKIRSEISLSYEDIFEKLINNYKSKNKI